MYPFNGKIRQLASNNEEANTLDTSGVNMHCYNSQIIILYQLTVLMLNQQKKIMLMHIL